MKKAIIFDLDNTLYDWNEAFYYSFIDMFNYIKKEFNISEEELIIDFKSAYKNEYSLDSINIVKNLSIYKKFHFSNEKLEFINQKANNIFINSWKKRIKQYRNVYDVLKLLNEKKYLIFALSDAPVEFIDLRLTTLGILQYFKKVYAVGNCLHCDLFSKHSKKIIAIAVDKCKPCPEVAKEIINSYNLDLNNVYLVGDSIPKDIFLAQSLGVNDIWARYGTKHKNEISEILKKITPWRTNNTNNYKKIVPTCTIDDISELINIIGD